MDVRLEGLAIADARELAEGLLRAEEPASRP